MRPVRAMLLDAPGRKLREAEIRRPELRRGEVRIRVAACGVCRTDLHLRDGELTGAKLPLVLGHQVVGTVVEGDDPAEGGRVGVPWLGWTCGECRYCRSGRENLCDRALFTGYTLDGGYAEEIVADRRYCLPLPDGPADGRARAAPLRRPDRLPRSPGRGRRRAGRALRLRGRGAHRRPARTPGGTARARLHAPRRRGGPIAGARARRRLGGRRRRAAGGARRRDHLRARRRARARGAGRGRARWHGRLCRHPHERDPVLPVRAPLGRAGAPVGREPDAGATAGSCSGPSPTTR